jgi:cystathionine beta-lyase/cystathionine gamma-synthase
MGGAVIASKKLIAAMRADFVVTGATLDPHAAFLIQRGLKTYDLRYERQCANAQRIAEFLANRPDVRAVHFPWLPTHRQHALARKQMHDSGSIVTFELAGDRERARRFANALQLFAISASLGSTESLVQPGELMRPRDLNETERAWAGVIDTTIRLSIGIEDADDLIEDLAQALERSTQA